VRAATRPLGDRPQGNWATGEPKDPRNRVWHCVNFIALPIFWWLWWVYQQKAATTTKRGRDR